MQDSLQTTGVDGTKHDVKDKDHGLYALMCCFFVYGVRSTVSVYTAGLTIPEISPRGHLHVDVRARGRDRGLCTFNVLFIWFQLFSFSVFLLPRQLVLCGM